MGKTSKKTNKRQREGKKSSGKAKKSRARRLIMRAKMKINRWKRYKEEISEGQRKGFISRWDTSGLEKHIKMLERFV